MEYSVDTFVSMLSNVVGVGTIRKVSTAAQLEALIAGGSLGSGDIISLAAGTYTLKPGARYEKYRHCDLYDIQVQGDESDEIVYDGGTW